MAASALGGSNSNQWSLSQHPLETIAQGIQSATSAEHRGNHVSHMMSSNEDPADIIAKVSGTVAGRKRVDDSPYFTNNEGIPFPDPCHGKTVGGIPMASDVFFFQKQQHFNRSKNFERMVHPCGSGAFGYFESKFLQKKGEKTPVFVRFSTVTLGREFPDEARNPRGFAIKFYTKEGNYEYYFIAKHGQKQFDRAEATTWSGIDPDYSKRDLWEAIERGDEIEWTAKVQIMQPEEADPDMLDFDPFDVTKAAFSLGSMVPGIPFSSLNFDGPMRVDANHVGNRQYAPQQLRPHKLRTDAAEPALAVGDIPSLTTPPQKKYLAQIYNIRARVLARRVRGPARDEVSSSARCGGLSKNAELSGTKEPQV
ncbi:catalase-like domain-containing protein [Xylaria palmicola]|nr:catalase-like domain-containing protein [Xylaria palmicola]